jgi:hypothetical protein
MGAGVVACAMVAALGLPAGSAQAAFPGVNAQIAFTTDRDGNQEVYGMAFDGAAQTNLTGNAAADYEPAFSPDGTRIAFVSERDGNPEIYTMKPDGSGLLRLTNDQATDTHPDWAPDGQTIAFASDRTGDFEVFSMKADGSSPTNLTNSKSSADTNPSYAPGGNWILFDSDRSHNVDIWALPVLRPRSSGTGSARPLGPARGGGGGPQPIDLSKSPKSVDTDATQAAWTPLVVLDQDLQEAIGGLGKASHKKTAARVHQIQADVATLIAGFPQVGGVGFGKLFGQLNRLNGSLSAMIRSKDPLGKARAKTKAQLNKALLAAKALAAEDGLGSDATKAFQDIAGALDKSLSSLNKGTLKEHNFLQTIHDLRGSFQDALTVLPKVQGMSFTALFGSLVGLSKAVHQALAVKVKDKKFVAKVKADLGTVLSVVQRLQSQLNAANRP